MQRKLQHLGPVPPGWVGLFISYTSYYILFDILYFVYFTFYIIYMYMYIYIYVYVYIYIYIYIISSHGTTCMLGGLPK